MISPIKCPYRVHSLQTNLLSEREDIFNQLKSLWLDKPNMKSVFLSGPRKMGKTSIMKSIELTLGDRVKVAYIDLLELGNLAEGVGELFLVIVDEISKVLNIQSPSEEEILDSLYFAFRRFLSQVSTALLKQDRKIIIALDEVEKIEDWVNTGRLDAVFIKNFQKEIKSYPNIAFVFAGLYTFEEMSENLSVLSKSIANVVVGFLSRHSVAKLLVHPCKEYDQNYVINYQCDCLDAIYDLTYGQPFLVQMIGMELIRNYNQQAINSGKSANQMFTVDDLNRVVNGSEIYDRSRYYFVGLWNDLDSLSQQILIILSRHQAGLSIAVLQAHLNTSQRNLFYSINSLLDQKLILIDTEENVKFLIELLRIWVKRHFN